MFTKGQKSAAESIYQKEIKKFLKPKDGLTHLVMVKVLVNGLIKILAVRTNTLRKLMK